MRIASLCPAATEIVRLLALGDSLFTSDETERVRSALESAGSADGALNAADLARLHPLLILNDNRAHADLAIPDVEILIFDPKTPEDLLDGMLRIGRALGADAAAEREMLRLRERVWRAQEYVNPYLDGPAVVVLENLHPLVVAGDPSAHLVERAGGRHILHKSITPFGVGSASGMQAGERRAGPPRTIDADDLVRARADIVVLALRGRTIEEMRSAWLGSALPGLVTGARVVLLEGEGALHRPGIAMIDALEFFVALLQSRSATMGTRIRWEELA